MTNPSQARHNATSPADDFTQQCDQTGLPRRRDWDPKRSNLVEEVLTGLVDLYRQGVLQHQIYPGALLRCGGDYARFYRNAFLACSEWSVTRFPNGWSDFVDELNQRLTASGIAVIDTRRAIKPGAWLPDWERKIVRAFSQDYRAGRCSKDEALVTLESEFGIKLRNGSVNYYFPAKEVASCSHSLDNRKDDLAARVQDMKKAFNLDLSMAKCVQGLVFEKFVGVVLRALNPEGPLESQAFCKISYRDLSGKLHYSVYPDWVCGNRSWEVKLRNTLVNILESALPQAIALGHKQTIVYREPCEEVIYMMEANIRLDDTLEAMELLSEQTAGTRMRDLIEYVPVSQLLSQLPPQHAAHSMLRTLDAHLGTASCEVMWEWIDSLDRISASADQLEARVSVLESSMQSGIRLSKNELSRLFGAKATHETSEHEGLSGRIRAITRARESSRDRLLLSVYNTAYNVAESQLLEQHIVALEKLPPNVFDEATLNVLATMEEQATLRSRRGKGVDPAVREKKVIAAFESTERLRMRDLLQDLDELDDRVHAEIERALESIDAHLDVQDELLQGFRIKPDRLLKVLKTELKTVSLSTAELSIAADELARAQEEVLGETRHYISSIFNELRALERTTHERCNKDWNIDPDTSAVHEMIAAARTKIDDSDERLQELPFARLVHALAQKIDEKKSGLSSNDRTFILNCRTYLSGAAHRAFLSAIESIVHVIDYHAAALPGLGYYPLSALAQGDASSESSAIEDRIRLAAGKMLILTRLNFSHSSIAAARDGQTLCAVREGRISSIVAELTSQVSSLTVLKEGDSNQTRVVIDEPNAVGVYLREAALLWEPDTIKDALAEAERRIRDVRADAWTCGMQLIKAVVDGNSISIPYIPEGGAVIVTVKLRELHPTRDREDALAQQERCFNVLNHTRVIQRLLSADVWSRRVAQARRLACIDQELAVEFIRQCMEISPNPRQPIAESARQMLEASTATDAWYEGLVGAIHNN